MVTTLRLLRIKTGMTQQDFAKQHGLNVSVLSRLERGREYIPPTWRAVLTEVLGVSERDICDERGFPKLDS